MSSSHVELENLDALDAVILIYTGSQAALLPRYRDLDRLQHSKAYGDIMTITHTIPTIDISPYLDSTSNTEARAKVVSEVRSACSIYGFFQVKGHGVPVEAQRNLLGCCKLLFDLPIEQKEHLSLKNNPARRQVIQWNVQLPKKLRISQRL